jgi:hypothetical protein
MMHNYLEAEATTLISDIGAWHYQKTDDANQRQELIIDIPVGAALTGTGR